MVQQVMDMEEGMDTVEVMDIVEAMDTTIIIMAGKTNQFMKFLQI